MTSRHRWARSFVLALTLAASHMAFAGARWKVIYSPPSAAMEQILHRFRQAGANVFRLILPEN